MRKAITALTVGSIIVTALWPSIAWAQAATQKQSFIKPFPKNDVYRLQLIGDWFAKGLRSYIADTMNNLGQVQTRSAVLDLRSLRRWNWNKTVANIASTTSREQIDIAVVMLGAAEFGSIRQPNGKRVALGTDAWRMEYTKRVDRVIKALKQKQMAVYWMGIPTLRNDRHDDNAQIINEILRERAYINGIRYIDTYTGFADEEGDYAAYGPDLTGKIRRLRFKDGIYFTAAGYQKLAHFAMRVIVGDIKQAMSEREIPLAGSELEQSRINPVAITASEKVDSEKRKTGAQQEQISQRITSTATSRPSPITVAPGLKDQKADDSTVTLRTVTEGIARTDTVKILRPAIQATVLALLTRGSTASTKSRIGESVQFELPGGIVLMHSITSESQSRNPRIQGQLSRSQSPFFRVWAKGERLKPLPGRSDYIEWPRPEPQPVVRAKLTQQAGKTLGQQYFRPKRKYTPEGFPPLPELKPMQRPK